MLQRQSRHFALATVLTATSSFQVSRGSSDSPFFFQIVTVLEKYYQKISLEPVQQVGILIPSPTILTTCTLVFQIQPKTLDKVAFNYLTTLESMQILDRSENVGKGMTLSNFPIFMASTLKQNTVYTMWDGQTLIESPDSFWPEGLEDRVYGKHSHCSEKQKF